MKSFMKVFALIIVWSTCTWMTGQEASAQEVSVSFQLFYDELSPYGMWVDYPNYGYVWIPNEGPGFSPYATDGRWIFTDDGWTWYSDYPWGWAPFHYGRWDYDNVYGWFWVPDNEWGPAWVSWRRSPGYYGWAPLRPGISITMVFARDYREPNERWIFVRDGDITRSDVDHRYINRRNNATIINRSTVIENTRRDERRNATYVAGPDQEEVQRVTRTSVKPVTIRENDRPGHQLDNGELRIYRPQVQKRDGNGQNPAPSKVMRLNEVRPASERNAGSGQRTVSPADNGRNQQAQPQKSQQQGREQNNRAVNPSNKAQPPQDVKPSPEKGREQQTSTDNPPKRGQPQSLNVKPSKRMGKDKQPQNVTSPRKNQEQQPPLPRAKQDEKKKGKQE